MNKAYAILSIVAVILFGLYVVREGGGSDEPSKDMAAIMCQGWVKDRLRAPATAKFPLLSDHAVTQTENRFRVRSHVDAQNAFGALVRTDWDCVTTYEGEETWRLDSMDLSP